MSDLAREITPVNIEEELKNSYLDYAMSVIVGRALPDVRDGLKPVHRRVLYAMNVLGNDWNKAYKKSARVVGDVIGKYHPHGDSAVYDTIVRMAQPFSLRYMLVDGQGNFGSIDGDSAAAMRYTEIRLAKIAHELMADLEKETVDFVDNYDGTERIPDVMPTKIPNLLVNGASGIAVGMATNIPPHNLTEVINGCLAYVDDEDISIEGLMAHIPGPDFPTAAIINGRRGIEEAYRTGRGKVYIRARADVHFTATGAVGLFDAATAIDNGGGREIRARNMRHQPFNADVFIVNIRQTAVNHFRQVMRRYVGGHPYGDPGGAVHQQVRNFGRHDVRNTLRTVIVVDEIDRLFFKIGHQLMSDFRQTNFGITHRRGGVAVDGTKVTLAVHQHVTQRERLRHTHDGVVYRGVAVRVVFTDYVTNDTG